MELGSCTSPRLSLPSMLAELRTSLGGCHSFLASLTETPHLLFRSSMLLDRSRPLNTAVLTDQARDLAGAVTFTRSTHGCGTLAGPSLESAGFRSQKSKGYAASPGLNQPGALQKPGRPGSVLLTRYDKYIPGIYLSYVPTQWIVLFEGSWRVSRLGIYMYMLVLSCGDSFIFYFYAFTHSKSKQEQTWYIPGVYQVNACHIPLIYWTQYNFY